MKRKVKYFKRQKQGKTYWYPWIGYSFRNKNGFSEFKREINLSRLQEEEVKVIDAVFRRGGGAAVNFEEVAFQDSVSIGAEWTAFRIAEQLGIVEQLDGLDEKYRQAAMCMILDRVINPRPYSKSALCNALPGSGLERVVADGAMKPKQHDYYAALEKLYELQPAIQRGLFRKRPLPQRMFLYDITSSYMEGEHCLLAAFGYNRDGKKGKMQIVIGLLTDAGGMPVAAEVFEGNTSDQTTVMGQIDKLRRDFGLEEVVFVGDRGMITSARRSDLNAEEYERIKYISALTRGEMFQFLDARDHPLQLGLFDRRNLVEIEHEKVRYVMCFNPEKEQEDRCVRLRLIEKTENKLEMVHRNVQTGNWKKQQVIAARLHRWLNHWGMGRFFNVEYGDGWFDYKKNEELIAEYEAVDGCYVLLSDTSPDEISTEQLQQRYKSLALVEQAFRTMKSTELYVRPVRHWNPERVKGHVFVCMLSYMIVRRVRDLELVSRRDNEENDDPAAFGDSLRSLWDNLSQIKIGKLKIGERYYEQLNPLSNKVKQTLEKAGASLTRKGLARLGLVE